MFLGHNYHCEVEKVYESLASFFFFFFNQLVFEVYLAFRLIVLMFSSVVALVLLHKQVHLLDCGLLKMSLQQQRAGSEQSA